MTNDDLKRFYPINANPENNKDFVRYDKNGNLKVGNATDDNDAVNLATLMKHAGGPGADLNYREAWTSGTKYIEYDVVYVDIADLRCFYLCINNIDNSTTSPELDTEHFTLYLQTPRGASLVFNSDWPTTGTTKAFCDAIDADTNATVGMTYLGDASFTDLPFNGNGDVTVQILNGPSNTKAIRLILTSGNVAPYLWIYTYWNSGSNVSGWIGFDPKATAETYTVTTIDWTALSSSDPYTYSATVTATYVVGNDTEVGIVNDQPVLFANYGFVVGAVSGQNVTIYALDKPLTDVVLTVDYRG